MAGTGDPTTDFLRSLDEPGRCVVRRAVPIFKPHTRAVPEVKTRDGRTVAARKIVVTEADLPGIVANSLRPERPACR